jgi:hypothetical protein
MRRRFDNDDLSFDYDISSIAGFQQQFIKSTTTSQSITILKKQSESVNALWIKVYKEERTVQNVALEALLPFSTICLCEAGFSARYIINSDLRSWLQQQNFLWWSLSSTRQRYEMFQNSQRAYIHYNTPISVISLCLSSNMCARKLYCITKN